MRDHYSITFAPLSSQVLIYTAVSHYILFKFSDKQLHVRDAVLMSNTRSLIVFASGTTQKVLEPSRHWSSLRRWVSMIMGHPDPPPLTPSSVYDHQDAVAIHTLTARQGGTVSCRKSARSVFLVFVAVESRLDSSGLLKKLFIL